MDPEMIQEVLEMIKTTSEAVYIAARHRAIAEVFSSGLPCLIGMVFFGSVFYRSIITARICNKEDTGMYQALMIASIFLFVVFMLIFFSGPVKTALSVDYRTYEILIETFKYAIR